MKYLHLLVESEQPNQISNALRDAGHFVLDVDLETYQKHRPWEGFDYFIVTNGKSPIEISSDITVANKIRAGELFKEKNPYISKSSENVFSGSELLREFD